MPITENIQNEHAIGEQMKNIEIPENADINEVGKETWKPSSTTTLFNVEVFWLVRKTQGRHLESAS